ncbi:hypothetical protein [Gelidibacter japonicus]|uniref:hypothetical protein n=1 Tax=Gelidibacter japonicus TaxID=1962232 RepID=UPI002AFFC6A9|nr:hypothetical protein [Gelidibacter japonicus]
MITTNAPSTKCNTTIENAPEKAITGDGQLSPYAQFVVAFQGYSFYEVKTGKVLTKSQVYWRDRILAMSMAITNTVDKRYKLVDSAGWTNGTLNS